MSMTGDYGLPFPLADVLYADPFYALSADLITADYVGLHRVGAVVCDHLAFSQEAIDWQIWVEKSATPVPRKIQITEKPDAYRFVIPKDAIEIELKPL